MSRNVQETVKVGNLRNCCL